MKKFLIVALTLFMLSLANVDIQAKGNDPSNANETNGNSASSNINSASSPQPAEDKVDIIMDKRTTEEKEASQQSSQQQPIIKLGSQSQNQVQNQGEEQNLNNAFTEQNAVREEYQQCFEQMNTVQNKIKAIYGSPEFAKGLGEQVRQIAKDQSSSQDKIEEKLAALSQRSNLSKVFIGTDYQAVKEIKQEMTQVENRLENLNQLLIKSIEPNDVLRIQEMITALEQQQVVLQERLADEEGQFSLLGWMFRWMNK